MTENGDKYGRVRSEVTASQQFEKFIVVIEAASTRASVNAALKNDATGPVEMLVRHLL